LAQTPRHKRDLSLHKHFSFPGRTWERENPKIVLADEPTAALDKKSGRDVVDLMQRLAKEQGCTILLVTHDNRILDIADRIVYMEDGRLADNPNVAVAVE
jgi:putative ABC transport system ATP-binding protein